MGNAFPPADARATIPHVQGRAVRTDTDEVTTLLQAPPPRVSSPQFGPPSAPPSLPKYCNTCGNRFPAEVFLCPNDSMPLVADGPLPEPVDPLIGQILNDTFQIVCLIGEGGMGRVYEARHRRLPDRRFAIKVLLPEFAQNQEIVARFQREAESASSISHPNVVEVIDIQRTRDGAPYIAAEFLDGEELGSFVEKVGRLGVPFAVGVCRQVCRALAAAHARGVVHRDMKPENVFLLRQQPGEQGVPRIKVIDFGVSRVKDHDIHLTQAGVILGTPSFMAPEQARAEVVDERADIYGVGAVLYNLLTGVRPFDAEDPTRTLILLLTEELTPARQLNPGIPPGLDAVMRRCLSKNKLERYSTMNELDAALAPFDPGDPKNQAAQNVQAVGPSQPPPQPMQATLPQPIVYARPPMPSYSMETEASATLPAEAASSLGMVALVLGTGRPGAILARRTLRPQVITYGVAVAGIVYVTLVQFLLGFARVALGDGAFESASSLVFLHLFAVGLSVVAAALAGQHVREKLWDDDSRLEPFAQDLRAAALFGLFGLAVTLGFSRWVGVSVTQSPQVAASAAWDILSAIGGAFCVAGFVLRRFAFGNEASRVSQPSMQAMPMRASQMPPPRTGPFG